MTVTTHRTRSNVTTLKELRDNLGTKVNEAVFSGERPLISRNGKTVAALISYEDLKLLEEYEELLDIEALRKARAEDDGYRIYSRSSSQRTLQTSLSTHIARRAPSTGEGRPPHSCLKTAESSACVRRGRCCRPSRPAPPAPGSRRESPAGCGTSAAQ